MRFVYTYLTAFAARVSVLTVVIFDCAVIMILTVYTLLPVLVTVSTKVVETTKLCAPAPDPDLKKGTSVNNVPFLLNRVFPLIL